VLDDFGHASDVGGDDGNFAGHGFEGGEAEGFELRGKQKKIGGGELFVDVVLFAEEENVLLKFFLTDEVFGGAAVRAVADEDELGGRFGADNGENFTTSVRRLTGRKFERCMRMGSPLGAHWAARPLSAVRL